MTFSGFVNCKNEHYKRVSPAGPQFMGINTFLSWWFAWASAMKIDFRQVCPGCNWACSTLACDGTKIGITFKEAFVKPIEHAETQERIVTHLRRNDRCFIQTKTKKDAGLFKSVRHNMRQLCLDIVDGKEPLINIDPYSGYIHKEAFPFIQRIISSLIMTDERASALKFLAMLFTDCSADVIVPNVIKDDLLKFLEFQENIMPFIEELKCYCPEMSRLLIHSYRDNNNQLPTDLVMFLTYICKRIVEIHNVDIKPE